MSADLLEGLMDWLWYVLIILGCMLASAFFSGSETALLRLAVRDLLRSTSRLLVTILLGNNIANILATATAAALFIALLGEETGIMAATAVMTVAVLIFAEVLPKAMAAAHPRRVSYLVALPLYLLHAVLWPVHLVFDRILQPLVQRIAGGQEAEFHTAEEVMRMARLARPGQGHGQPLAIIGATAGAAKMTVSEIMVPRTEIVAFPDGTPPDELLEQTLEERYTRVPIYEGDIDHILGVVHLKDLIKLVRENGEGALASVLKPVLRVPERKAILPLLEDMQHSFCHVAMVKNEFGVTLGMVTQEDILEEIVGEIRDEFDREELLAIRQLPDQSFQALGRVKVLDFNRQSGWEVPAQPGDTLSGLVFNALGRGPRKGDAIRVPGYELAVADVSGTRIVRVRVRQVETPAQPRSARG
jgi:putative hemolysin